jgi:hypothetical protein
MLAFMRIGRQLNTLKERDACLEALPHLPPWHSNWGHCLDSAENDEKEKMV